MLTSENGEVWSEQPRFTVQNLLHTSFHNGRKFIAGDAGGIATGETFYAPRNLIASKGALSSGVAVSWDRVLDATGYQVYRSETNVRADAQLTGTIEALAESPESRVEYNDPSAEPEIGYAYWVRAVDGEQVSGFSGADFGFRRRGGEEALLSWGSFETISSGDVNATQFAAVDAGVGFNGAINGDGSLSAWGLNNFGQTSVPEASNAVAVSAGGWHGLALLDDGSVVAWGDNEFGQADVPEGVGGVQAISAGFNHSLALTEDGIIVAWGNDESEQVTEVPDSDGPFASISAGGDHNLALTESGRVVAWGDNRVRPDGCAG